MPDAFFQADSSLPDLKRYKTADEKLDAVQNYLFLLLENLRWLLRNLSPENFNQTEMTDWIGKTVKAETIVSNTVITNELYSEYGAIADLTVDSLRTDYRRARRYLAGDTSPIDYLRIHDEVIEFVTAETTGAQTEQLSVDGRDFYWTDSSMTQMTSEKVTAYPVTVYVYTEDVKGAFRFENVTHNGQTVKVPVLRLGAGDENGRNYATLYKGTQGLRVLYNDAAGNDVGMVCSKDGYTDLYGLRKPLRVNLSGWDDGHFSAVTDGGYNHGFSVSFDAQDRPARITDGAGHQTAVIWEGAGGAFDDQPVPIANTLSGTIAVGIPFYHSSIFNQQYYIGVTVPGVYVFALEGNAYDYFLAAESDVSGTMFAAASGGSWYPAFRTQTCDAATGLYTWTRSFTYPEYANSWEVPTFSSLQAGLAALRAHLDAQ